MKILKNSSSAFSVAELVDPYCQVFCFFLKLFFNLEKY